jgi:hypothetical protein
MSNMKAPIQKNRDGNGCRLASIRTKPPISVTSDMQRNSSQLENEPTAIFGSLMGVSMLSRRSSLAEGFEEDDAGGDGNVEGFDGAGSRQRDDEVAALAGQFVQALTFAP